MKYAYKSVKYTPKRWNILKHLAELLSKERGGIEVSIPDATIEAVSKLIDDIERARENKSNNTAATPGGQAQD